MTYLIKTIRINPSERNHDGRALLLHCSATSILHSFGVNFTSFVNFEVLDISIPTYIVKKKCYPNASVSYGCFRNCHVTISVSCCVILYLCPVFMFKLLG